MDDSHVMDVEKTGPDTGIMPTIFCVSTSNNNPPNVVATKTEDIVASSFSAAD